MRHAARGPLPHGEPGDEVPITPEGRAGAVALGRSLGPRLASLYTSPVLRCVQTAEAMARGAGLAASPAPDPHLGDPGVYVSDAQAAWDNWLRLGHEGVVRALIAGERLPGLADPHAASRALLRWAAGVAGGRAGAHVFVTHDLLLACAASHALGEALAPPDWPDFLEALTLELKGGHAEIRYRELARPLPWPLTALAGAGRLNG